MENSNPLSINIDESVKISYKCVSCWKSAVKIRFPDHLEEQILDDIERVARTVVRLYNGVKNKTGKVMNKKKSPIFDLRINAIQERSDEVFRQM